jgi:hypothetical protein
LMASMTSKPLTEPLLGVAIFSPWKPAVSSSSSDASQPYTHINICIVARNLRMYICSVLSL